MTIYFAAFCASFLYNRYQDLFRPHSKVYFKKTEILTKFNFVLIDTTMYSWLNSKSLMLYIRGRGAIFFISPPPHPTTFINLPIKATDSCNTVSNIVRKLQFYYISTIITCSNYQCRLRLSVRLPRGEGRGHGAVFEFWGIRNINRHSCLPRNMSPENNQVLVTPWKPSFPDAQEPLIHVNLGTSNFLEPVLLLRILYMCYYVIRGGRSATEFR